MRPGNERRSHHWRGRVRKARRGGLGRGPRTPAPTGAAFTCRLTNDAYISAVLCNDVYAAMRLLCIDVPSGSSQAESAAQKISDWASTKHLTAGPLTHLAQRDLGSGVINVTTLAVAVHQVRDMVRMHPFTGI